MIPLAHIPWETVHWDTAGSIPPDQRAMLCTVRISLLPYTCFQSSELPELKGPVSLNLGLSFFSFPCLKQDLLQYLYHPHLKSGLSKSNMLRDAPIDVECLQKLILFFLWHFLASK